jgi:tRNA A37 threonylcarbamoyladenosine dehydratase
LGCAVCFLEKKTHFHCPNGEVTTKPEARPSKPLDCNTGMGSASFSDRAFGFAATAEAVRLITTKKKD